MATIGNASINDLTRNDVEVISATFNCSVDSTWALSKGQDMPNYRDHEPSSSASGTTTTTTAQWMDYKNLTFKWTFPDGVVTKTVANTEYRQFQHTVNGLQAGQGQQVRITLEVSETPVQSTITFYWRREEKKDEEGKGTGEYTDWTFYNSNTTSSDRSPSVFSTKTFTPTVYTKPNGSFSWDSTVSKGYKISSAITSSAVSRWINRCKIVINWARQNNTYSMRAGSVSSGSRITAAIYRNMVTDASQTTRSFTAYYPNQGTTITPDHWIQLQRAVNF